MADGPCGEAFKESFSCFMFSQEEEKGEQCRGPSESCHKRTSRHALKGHHALSPPPPSLFSQGSECVELFRNLQECMVEHSEYYGGSEAAEEEAQEAAEGEAQEAATAEETQVLTIATEAGEGLATDESASAAPQKP